MKKCLSILRRILFGISLVGLLPGGVLGQGSPLLQITTVQTSGGRPVEFTFHDAGTGATNYAVEFAPDVGAGGVWSKLTSAVIVSQGAGTYQVLVPALPPSRGFFRVRGAGADGGAVTAAFSSTALQATEGGMALPTLVFSAPYHGIVRYTISGTVAAGEYMSLSGEVFVNGTTVTIPVTLLDNQSLGPLRYLTLTLEAGPGLQLGAGRAATITIDENDAEWQGSFTTDGATVGFVLKIQESNGVKLASLKSNGLGLFPTNELPAGLLFTMDEFAASVSDIAVPASATLLNEPMTLSLFLSARNGGTNQSVSAIDVEGSALLVTTVPARTFLSTTNAGSFVLVKPPVKPSTNQVELVAAP